MNNIILDRDKRLILLRWLQNGIIDAKELQILYAESTGDRVLSMEEARAFLKHLEETY